MGQCPKGSEKPLKNFGKGSDGSGCIAEVTLTTWQVGEIERGKSRFRKKSEEAVESSGEDGRGGEEWLTAGTKRSGQTKKY